MSGQPPAPNPLDPVVGTSYLVRAGRVETAAPGIATIQNGTRLTVVGLDATTGEIEVDATGMAGVRGEARTSIRRADWDGLTLDPASGGRRRRKTRARKSRRRSTRRRR